METYYLSNATGTVHRKWINHPYLFAGVLFFYALLICIIAWVLGIWSNFGPDKEYIGFCSPNWGMLYPIALPIVALCTSFFLRVCSSAIKSLDSIILHKKNDKICFSHVILERIKKGWRIIFLISIITSVLIVALADGSDIIEPFLKSSSSHHKDWTTHGYTLAQNLSYAYLLFNIFAFSMEAFLAYCGLTLLLGASTMIYWVIAKLSILEISRKDKMKKHEKKYINDQIAQSFKIQWDWDGQNGRCGLHEFDKVYGTYVACIVLTLILSAISIFWNVHLLGKPDLGSWILAIGPVIIFPGAFFWIIYPYWQYFPDSRDDDPDGNKKIQPVKWPFGSVISWSFIIMASSLWLFIVKSILQHIKFLPSK